MRPLGDARTVGAGEVRYLSGGHASEGGHEVALNGHRVTVLPDGRTTARQRSHAITTALQADPDPLPDLIGRLILAGVSNLAVDDTPVVVGEQIDRLIASLRLDVSLHDSGVLVKVVETGGVA